MAPWQALVSLSLETLTPTMGMLRWRVQVDFLPTAAMTPEELEKQRAALALLAKATRVVDFDLDGEPAQVPLTANPQHPITPLKGLPDPWGTPSCAPLLVLVHAQGRRRGPLAPPAAVRLITFHLEKTPLLGCTAAAGIAHAGVSCQQQSAAARPCVRRSAGYRALSPAESAPDVPRLGRLDWLSLDWHALAVFTP